MNDRKAVSLIKNPLTVIAVFAGLAEVCATIALPQLEAEVQKTFVWFVMLFPTLLVILFFVVLWLKHHVLYAPSDFSNEDNFMRHWRHATGPDPDLEDIGPEAYPTSDESNATTEQGTATSNPPILEDYQLAESKIVPKLEDRLGLSFTREVELSRGFGLRYDAIAQTKSGAVLLEIKLVRSLKSAASIARKEMYRVASLATQLSKDELKGSRLILAIVSKNRPTNEETAVAKERLLSLKDTANLPIELEFEFYTLDELRGEDS